MEKMKKLKAPLIILALIIASVCAAAVISEVTAMRLSDIANYEEIFTDVEKIQYYDGDDNFFTTVAPEKRLGSINKIKLREEPVSEEAEGERPYRYRLVFDENYTVYITEDLSALWIDDADADGGKASSHIYSVRNPGALKKLFN